MDVWDVFYAISSWKNSKSCKFKDVTFRVQRDHIWTNEPKSVSFFLHFVKQFWKAPFELFALYQRGARCFCRKGLPLLDISAIEFAKQKLFQMKIITFLFHRKILLRDSFKILKKHSFKILIILRLFIPVLSNGGNRFTQKLTKNVILRWLKLHRFAQNQINPHWKASQNHRKVKGSYESYFHEKPPTHISASYAIIKIFRTGKGIRSIFYIMRFSVVYWIE